MERVQIFILADLSDKQFFITLILCSFTLILPSIHLELIYILHCFGAQKALSDDFGKLASYLTCSGFYSPSVFIAMTCIVFIQHCKRNPSQGGLAVMPGVMCAQAFSFQFPFPLLDALFFKADSFTLPLILSQFMYTCVCSSEWLHVHSLGQPHC